MKKIISITLIFLIIAGLLAGCNKTEDTVEAHQLSKITVIKEPNSQVIQIYNKLFGNNYNSLQAAYKDMVNKYNETYDNDILYLLCKSLDYQFIIEGNIFSVISNEYIKDINKIKIEYYSEIFNKIWANKKFNKKTAEYHRDFADDLLHSLYYEDMIKQSIEFYDKYAEHLKDRDELVQFAYWYSLHYFNDNDPDHDAMVSMLNRVKTIENNYYDKVVDNNQFIILAMISEYSYKLGDEKTGNEYHQKATDVINKIMNNIED